MMYYMLQVVAFQLLFLVVYDVFLKKETFFNWNRVYLIGTSLIAFIVPFVKIESFKEAVPQKYVILLPEIILTAEKTTETASSWQLYIIIGIIISSFLFCYKLYKLLRLKLQGNITRYHDHIIIKIPNSTLAFSFLHYVFIGEKVKETQLASILAHELVHIREKHSFDLLYFELLRIVCWFNPLVYMYQKRISTLHEYIADAKLTANSNKSDYYKKLLAEVFQTEQFSFANQFFKHSLIKKRILMLTKQKSKTILKLKYLLLIPALTIALVYTSCESTAEENPTEVETAVVQKIETDTEVDQLMTFKEIDKAPVFPGCESEDTLEGLKKCFIKKLNAHVGANFDVKKATELKLEGQQRIIAKFVVNKQGDIENIQVEAPHPVLKEEAELLINKLPKLSPGMKDGKPVNISYILPIIFKVK